MNLKELLKKAKPPVAGKAKDPMLESEGEGLEIEIGMGEELPEGEEKPESEMEMEEMPESEAALAEAEDEALVKELEARGYKVAKKA